MKYRFLVLVVGILLSGVPSAQTNQAVTSVELKPFHATDEISIDRSVAFPVDI